MKLMDFFWTVFYSLDLYLCQDRTALISCGLIECFNVT